MFQRLRFLLVSQSSTLPIGTILPYIGELNQIPKGWALCDGTNGTPNLINRFLEGTTSNPKQFKEAGLPQHQHIIYASDNGKQKNGKILAPVNQWLDLEGDGGRSNRTWGYSRSSGNATNSIYGASDTVQPASYTVYYIMRVA